MVIIKMNEKTANFLNSFKTATFGEIELVHAVICEAEAKIAGITRDWRAVSINPLLTPQQKLSEEKRLSNEATLHAVVASNAFKTISSNLTSKHKNPHHPKRQWASLF
jgi:hypothetical protein